VRHNVRPNTSLALPHRDIGAIQIDTWHLRKPTDRTTGDNRDWKDVVGYAWANEQLAEGPVWESSVHGARLPATLRAKNENHELSALPVLPRLELFAKRRLNCLLWANEDGVGERLLEPTEKDLLAEHADLNMRIPTGWHFPEGAAFLQRIY
jgi:hypothetical protein